MAEGDFSPQYNPKDIEEKIYRMWEKSGFFNPDKLPSAKRGNKKTKNFCITVPPPNVTGSLHMGHALNAVIQDVLARKKRMEGYKTLWLPGTDHAGIATQNAVEKELKKQGISRRDLGREKFLEKVWEWKERYGNIILDQFKKLGSSMDWSRTRFTMDEEYQEAVKRAFLHYREKGWIYRAERVVSWCPRCFTSLSDLELEHKETDGALYYINYPLADGSGVITVATTRPETMLGDSAVAVRSGDKRYKNLIGKYAVLPLKNRKIPIVGDRAVDSGFGTGAVKVTPAHDFSDAEIGERHKLLAPKIIGPDGRMSKEAGPLCAGLKVFECRAKVLEELRLKKFLEREEAYKHNVAVCYRCGAVIEPIPSEQWFLKMGELAKAATRAVKSGKVKFHPKRWEKIYLDWLKNVKDWCISRQIWWGHKIPLGNADDVLDTWFSSALWPFAALGWPRKTKDLAEFYPTSVLSTARDIINLWVARMVFSGMEFAGKEPFRDVIVHATILTKDGKRMSKSLGTGVDPMDLISRYGADATRFGLIWQAMGGQDIRWSEEHVVAGRKFCNKIWNAARFALQNADSEPAVYGEESGRRRRGLKSLFRNVNLTPADKKILQELEKIKKETDKFVSAYEFGRALRGFYDFFWHKFCDSYLEQSKEQMAAGEERKKSTQKILLRALADSLKLIHPFMPFISEEIWRKLPLKNKKALIIELWPL